MFLNHEGITSKQTDIIFLTASTHRWFRRTRQAVYPISVRGSTIWEDLHALEAFRLIEIEGVTPDSEVPLPDVVVPAAASAAAAPAEPASGVLPQTNPGTDEKRKKQDHLTLSFRDLVVHQVRDRLVELSCSI